METLRIGARALGIELTPGQIEQFERFYAELLAWNRVMNLTAIVKRAEVETKHFLDSLSALLVPPPPDATVVDVGAGGGLPGIPLKIARPDIHLTLLESTGKKAQFLRHVVRVLGLSDVEVLIGRAEDVGRNPAYRDRFDLALARAVAALPVLAELTLPLVRVGGWVVAYKQGDIAEELAGADRAIQVLSGRLEQVVPVDLPGLPPGRKLVVLGKARSTPAAYPRRAGIPSKRPL